MYSISSPKLTCKSWISTSEKSCTCCPNWREGVNSGNARKNAFFSTGERLFKNNKLSEKHIEEKTNNRTQQTLHRNRVALIVVSILASTMAGSGDRERNTEEKITHKGKTWCFCIGPNRLKRSVLLYQKYLFFCGNFVCGTYAFRGNNSEWSQPGRKPNFCFPAHW